MRTQPSLRATGAVDRAMHRVIRTSGATRASAEELDCFVAIAPRNDAEGRNGHGKSSTSSRNSHRPMPVRQGRLRNRHPGALGLARSFGRLPPRAWRGLCHLCRQLAQAVSGDKGQGRHRALRGQGHQNRAQLLRPLRHAADLRAPALAAHGQHPARAVFRPHRPAAALSHRDRGTAGMGLHRRAAGAAEGFSRRGLAALEKEEARRRRSLELARGDI